jgi:hypothetical protein
VAQGGGAHRQPLVVICIVGSISDAEFGREVRRCRDRLHEATAVLEERGSVPGWFRFPYLQRGRTPEKRDAALAIVTAASQRVAPVTIDTSEWALAKPYVDALKAGDKARAQRIGAGWVEHIVAASLHARQVAKETLKQPIPQVLLLHANAVAADYLGTLLAKLARAGFAFESFERVMEHPVYARADHYAGPVGLSWLYRIEEANQARRRWDWDNGQLRALRRRFGLRPDQGQYAIGRGMTARPLAPRVHLIVHTGTYAANSLVVELADGGLLFIDTPPTPVATHELVGWARARFGDVAMRSIHSHAHEDASGGIAALAEWGVVTYGSTHTAGLLAANGSRRLIWWLHAACGGCRGQSGRCGSGVVAGGARSGGATDSAVDDPGAW